MDEEVEIPLEELDDDFTSDYFVPERHERHNAEMALCEGLAAFLMLRF